MKNTDSWGRYHDVLKVIRESLTLEDLVGFVRFIEMDSEGFMDRLVLEFDAVKRDDLVGVINEKNDFSNVLVKDFIDFCFSKGEDISERLFETYRLLNKGIVPAGGFMTKDCRSISFEYVPKRPIARLSFDGKRSIAIVAKGNVIELSL